MWNIVEKPVNFSGPGITIGIVELFQEISQSLFFWFLHTQGLADVSNVIQGLKLGDATLQHHGEEGDDEVGVPPQNQVCPATQLLKPAQSHQSQASQMKSSMQEIYMHTRDLTNELN